MVEKSRFHDLHLQDWFSRFNVAYRRCTTKLLDTLVHDNLVLHTVQEICDFDGWRRWMHTRMLLPVEHHRRPLGEALAANVTYVRPLADMGQQVNLL